ncbi:hypothetical protein SBRY_90126 [Actinacidiphila bryophytorum]|uniref:Uncharacterized protein n=1 Tax=Actinacidiphila bryophytorum TaxID=1436133 RepID=A0A9W4H8K5_9ACTN|nr:hypothetical protein SBRY_90126 [Actinacidiphila bryophytorum]
MAPPPAGDPCTGAPGDDGPADGPGGPAQRLRHHALPAPAPVEKDRAHPQRVTRRVHTAPGINRTRRHHGLNVGWALNDGADSIATTGVTSWNATNAFTIGRAGYNGANTGYFSGRLSIVHAWSCTLDSLQFSALYKQRSTDRPPVSTAGGAAEGSPGHSRRTFESTHARRRLDEAGPTIRGSHARAERHSTAAGPSPRADGHARHHPQRCPRAVPGAGLPRRDPTRDSRGGRRGRGVDQLLLRLETRPVRRGNGPDSQPGRPAGTRVRKR